MDAEDQKKGPGMTETGKEDDPLTREIIAAAMEVHSHLGPGLLESAYRVCLAYELSRRGLKFQMEKPLPVQYKEVKLDCGYKLDIVVEDKVVVEAKAVDELHMVHQAQLLSYLKIGGYKVGLLLNFHAQSLRQGLKRIVLDY